MSQYRKIDEHTVEIICPFCSQWHVFKADKEVFDGKQPIIVICPNIHRMYRFMSLFIDTRRNILKSSISDEHKNSIINDLKRKLGEYDFDKKYKRWISIDFPQLGVIEEYTYKINEIVDVYSMGYFYPSMTSAGALAERILNRLILKLRIYFKCTKEYKKVYNKSSFDNWDTMIEILISWKILDEQTSKLFKNLKKFRNDVIHYSESYDFENNAHHMIDLLIKIINSLYGVFYREDLFWIFNVPGEIWVRSNVINSPFVKEFILPHCYYAHAIHEIDEKRHLIDEKGAIIGILTDEEFIKLRKDYCTNKNNYRKR